MTLTLCRGSNERFTNAVPIRGNLCDDKPHAPQPDFWFGLHLYEEKHLSLLRGLEIEDKGIRYFTPDLLDSLHDDQGALIYQPVESRKHASFPWMIAELKKEHGKTDECLEQAANDCYTCLKLGQRLAGHMGQEPLPVIALTAIGPEAKIFISYCDTRGKKNFYVCVSATISFQFVHQPTDSFGFSANVLHMGWKPPKHNTRHSDTTHR